MRRIFASLLTAGALLCLAPADAFAQAAPAAPAAAGSRVGAAAPVTLTLPLAKESVRFMVVGDTGTGSRQQNELAAVMLRYWQAFPFEFVLLVGDNMYGSEK